MNYPVGTLVQSYNVAAGRVIQLPCFLDQPEPPDGFRAVIFSQPQMNPTTGGVLAPPVNQTGPNFRSGVSAAINFDLTQLTQNNVLSRARSIVVTTEVLTNANVTAQGQGLMSSDLLFDSGFTVPTFPWMSMGDSTATTANFASNMQGHVVADFLSATPIFSLLMSANFTNTQIPLGYTVTVTNFKLSPAFYMAGLSVPAGG